MDTARPKLRHRWNHQAQLHRSVVTTANQMLARLPIAPRYQLMMRRRRNVLPYRLLDAGDVVVQVGAPRDTLLSGRSRGMALALMAPRGRVLLVDPSERSLDEYRRVASLLDNRSAETICAALYSAPMPSVTFYEDMKHPARNFIESALDVLEYDEAALTDFEATTVPATTLDDLWRTELAGSPVRLVSVTTNGSEEAILEGATEMLKVTDYLALAVTTSDVTRFASQQGFELVDRDDRGFTYQRIK